uniref:Uncharacterized protein n=1 Tax=Gopherus evgoodei TaxID=1825980 RepID=A0A8C4YU85_9SAUR
MTEDDSLANSDAPIDIAQGLVFILYILTQKVVLPDIGQGHLLSAEFNYDGVKDDLLSKPQHSILKGCGEEEHLTVLWLTKGLPLNADTLHKHRDLLQIQHPGGSNYYLIFIFLAQNSLRSKNGILCLDWGL